MKTDKFTLFVYCNFLVLPSTTVCSQNINKQNVNIADETLTNYSFLSRNHYTKSKNYLKDNIEFVTEFPCLLGHPVLEIYKMVKIYKLINMHTQLCIQSKDWFSGSSQYNNFYIDKFILEKTVELKLKLPALYG